MTDADLRGTPTQTRGRAASVTAAAAAPPAPSPADGGAPVLAATSVPTACNIGWLLAELRGWAADRARPEPKAGLREPTEPHNDPPSRLEMAPSAEVKVEQIRAKLTLLRPDVEKEGVPASRMDVVFATLDAASSAVSEGTLNTGAIDALFTSISEVLTVASIRMGRALDLGFDLANTCRMPQEETAGAAERAFLDLFGARVVKVQEALADLATSLPEHSARGVSLSLAEWQFWAGRLTLNKAPVSWPDPAVNDALRRQGEVWRSVLAGEKLGQDMLSSDDYFSAMR